MASSVVAFPVDFTDRMMRARAGVGARKERDMAYLAPPYNMMVPKESRNPFLAALSDEAEATPHRH
jgi:hypothetical protein